MPHVTGFSVNYRPQGSPVSPISHHWETFFTKGFSLPHLSLSYFLLQWIVASHGNDLGDAWSMGCALSSQPVRQGWCGTPAEKGLLIQELGSFCVLAPLDTLPDQLSEQKNSQAPKSQRPFF